MTNYEKLIEAALDQPAPTKALVQALNAALDEVGHELALGISEGT